ncbi:MAG: ABC transporter substrate-binding protein [Actinobacteria bacterium]|nr:ABC transporter substrate-binding protein [Actinomycetota bacterium]MCG2802934.1 ABC transporter substrate-binding protein [Cellulomonas sp.]
MHRTLRHSLVVPLLAASAALALAACGSSGSAPAASSASGGTLVVDSTFDLKTADPARSYEFTGELLGHNVYEHATTFEGTDLTKPVPELTTFAFSPDNRTLTLTLNGEHKFADGTPVTVDDIVFSYQRVQGITGSPSFLLDGVTVAKVDEKSLTLTTTAPNLALPAVLANPSLGIVEKSLVVAHGGTTGTDDAAEAYLNTASAGSAAYQIDTLDVSSKIVLKRNPNYVGTAPTWDKIVIENVAPATQKLNVQSGTAQIALDISPDGTKGVDGGSTTVINGISGFTVYTFFAADAEHGKAASDPNFVAAVRHAIDYSKLLDIAGKGSVQPGGVVPVQFPGALTSDPTNSYDVAKAKELLARSTYAGEPISYLYASDVTVQGLRLELIAQSIQADLKAVGITLQLDPQPAATYYSTLRSNTVQAALSYWGPDFPDASNYLAFTPGQGVAKRANWTADSATGQQVAPLVAAAQAASADTRNAAYQDLQRTLNEVGPIVPLLQPAQSVVTTTTVSDVVPSPLWLLDLASIH